METTKRVINTSEKFGSWIVLDKQGKQVLCECDCGTQKLVYSHTLTNGRSTNCGCKKRKESIPVAAIIKAHANGEANMNKLAIQYQISTKDAINIILHHA
ncbi:hypothetical protein [Nostoc sp.]|uniref:hypothetical protein n=1 Tax=Nostoc sp. TaxID=1180 RepID=UPI002FF6F97B